MASRQLDVSLRNKKGLNDAFTSPRKVNNFLTTPDDCYQTTKRYYVERNEISPQSTAALATTNTFRVNDSDLLVGDFMLKFVVVNATGAACPYGWIANLIQRDAST